MKRAKPARIVNLFVPGSGLILLRREWVGLATAGLFTVLAQTAILGWWVVPLDIPVWVATACGAGAALVWLQSQWSVWRRVRAIYAPALLRELADLRAQAAEALARGDLEEAHRVLLVALAVNDEDVELMMLWAALMQRMGRLRAARRTWRRVLALDAPGPQRQAAQEALAAS